MFTIINEIEITKQRFDDAAACLRTEAELNGEAEAMLIWFGHMRNDYHAIRALEREAQLQLPL